MKFSFIKCAAALLTGALLAVACSKDYEADIQRLENKIDQVSSGTGDNSIPGLQAQLKALEALVEQYNTQLKADLASNLQDQTNKYNELLSKYNSLDQTFKDAKAELIKAIGDANTKIGNLENKDAELTKAIQDAITDYNAKINQAISDMRTALANQAIKDGAQDQAIEGLKGRLDALEIQIAKDIAACKTYTNEQIAALKELMETKDAELSSALVAYKAEVKSELDGMKADIQANKESIVTLNAQMDQVKNTDIPAIKAKIEAIELRLHDDEEDIQANADAITALQELTATNFNTLKSLIETIETNYKAADEAIKADINTKYAEIIARFADDEEDIQDILDILNDESTGYDAIWAKINELNAVQSRMVADLIVVRDSVNLVDQKYAKAVREINAAIDAINANLLLYQEEAKNYVDSVNTDLLDSIVTRYEHLVDAYTAADEAIRDDYNQKIADAKNDLYEKSKVDSLALGALIDALDGKLNTLQADFDDLSDKVDSLCAAVPQALEELKNNLEDEIGKKADTADFNAFVREVAQKYLTNEAFEEFKTAYETRIGEAEDAIEELEAVAEAITARLDVLEEALNKIFDRIQSVQFVPTHSDLKMTVNYAQLSMDDRVVLLPMKTKVTYKVNPENAFESDALLKELFASFQKTAVVNENNDTSYVDNTKQFMVFDVKDVETRSYYEKPSESGADLVVTDIVRYNPETGYIEMNVMADTKLMARGIDNDGLNYFVLPYAASDIAEMPWYYQLGAWIANQSAISQALSNVQNKVAVALEIRKDKVVIPAKESQQEVVNDEPAVVAPDTADNAEIDNPGGQTNNDKEFNISNVSSPYTILYMNADAADITFGGAAKKTGEKKTVKDIQGNDVEVEKLVAIDEELQKLPYNATEAIPAHETVNGKDTTYWYRIILDGAVPAYEIDGELYTPADACKLGYAVPTIKMPAATEFEYYDPQNAKIPADNQNVKDYFKNNSDIYGQVIMHPTTPAVTKRAAIDWTVRGIYNFVVEGFEDENVYSIYSDVKIIKPTAAVTVYASAKWNYTDDAEVDHHLAYECEVAKLDSSYHRIYMPIDSMAKVGDKTALQYLNDIYGLSVEDFAGKAPNASTIKVQDKDDEAAVAYPAAGYPKFFDHEDGYGENEADHYFGVKLLDEEPYIAVSIKDFNWDEQYTYTATYQTDYCDLDVTFIFTTTDRNREKIVVELPEQIFKINQKPAEGKKNGFTDNKGYFAQSDEIDEVDSLYKHIYQAFLTNKIITEEEFPTASSFYAKEIKNWIKYIDSVPGANNWYKENDLTNGDVDLMKIRIGNEMAFAFLASRGFNQSGYAPDYGWTAAQLKELCKNEVEGNAYAKKSNPIADRIANYIGQLVEVSWVIGYQVPKYDFQHQKNYTMADGAKWYSMASPKYDLNRDNLKHYDVNYMNVPALAFNIIDEEKRIFNVKDDPAADDPNYFYDDSLKVNFYYTGPAESAPVDTTTLEKQSRTRDINVYGDLWFDAYEMSDEYDVWQNENKNFEHTVFYYRSIRDAIPMYGTLEIASDTVRFEIPTSFKGNGYLSGNDYSKFELRAWKPFYVPTYIDTLTIKLRDNVEYFVNLFEGIQFYDARQVAASTDVTSETFEGEGVYSIPESNNGVKSYFRPMFGWDWHTEDGAWGVVRGNMDKYNGVDEGQTPNGFRRGYTSFEAYELSVSSFDVDKSGIPVDLRSLIDFNPTDERQQINGVWLDPYQMVFNYDSQIQFNNSACVEFAFKFQTPWQKFDDNGFVVVVEILGFDAQ